MNYPKVLSVNAINDNMLLIEFDNKQKKTYNVNPLLKKEMFSPLKNPSIFKTVKIEQGGYAVSWGRDIDISEYELWKHGQKI